MKKRRAAARTPPVPNSRAQAVAQLRSDLLRQSWPRLQMSLLVSLTGGAGLLASFLMLHAGIASMTWRYPLALLAAYGVFLLLLWLWLRTRVDDWADLPDPGFDLSLPGGRPMPNWSSGGGGDFGGGGASASFNPPMPTASSLPVPTPTNLSHDVADGASDGLADGLGAVGDAIDVDELAIPLLVVALAIGLALSSLYVVYSAPTLFAELLLDGALSATLYRRLRHIERQHWVSTAIRRTVWPFALTALLLAAVGWGLQSLAPQAHTLGEAIRLSQNHP